jgi:hypothetical protein
METYQILISLKDSEPKIMDVFALQASPARDHEQSE